MTDPRRGYRDDSADSAGREGPDSPPIAAPLLRRWSLQVQMIRGAAWFTALCARRATASTVHAVLPSALSPAVPSRRASMGQAWDGVPTDHHYIEGTPSSSNEDAWTAFIETLATDPASVRLVLPRPGDPRGVIGQALDDACASGASISVRLAGEGLNVIAVRHHEGLTTWHRVTTEGDDARTPEAPAFDTLSASEAQRHLKEMVLQAEGALSGLGHRGLGDGARDHLEGTLHALTTSSLPLDRDLLDRPLLMRAMRLMWMCDVALDDESPAISSADAQDRRRIIGELERAARRCVEASLAPVSND